MLMVIHAGDIIHLLLQKHASGSRIINIGLLAGESLHFNKNGSIGGVALTNSIR